MVACNSEKLESLLATEVGSTFRAYCESQDMWEELVKMGPGAMESAILVFTAGFRAGVYFVEQRISG